MLRAVRSDDLEVFYEQQLDPDAIEMAGFPARDRADYLAHWSKVLDDASAIARTIIADGHIVGHVDSFWREGAREVGYWIGRAYWGQGLATAALVELLDEVVLTRPLYARVVEHNLRSVRVLARCGFVFHSESQPVGLPGKDLLLRLTS